MTQKNQNFDVIIVGAGVIGATQALLLAKRSPNVRIAVIDQTKLTAFPKQLNVRATALGQQAKLILEECGVWQQVPSECLCAYNKMVVLDEQSQGELAFDCDELGALSLGHIVDHFALQALLQKAMSEDKKITEHYECSIAEIVVSENDANSSGQHTVFLTNGVQISTTLIIAADGVNSQVREIAGIDVHRNTYGQSGIVAIVETEIEHQNTAWQRFLDSGPLAFLPLSNGNSSIVWSVDDTQIAFLKDANESIFCQRLKAVTQGCFGELSLKSARHIFPLNSQRALQYYKNNIVLIGDAAHGIHPLAGQGANLGFADVALLTEQLSEFPTVLSHAALRRYERQRKADNYAVDAGMTIIQKGFAQSSMWISILRGLGMNFINQNKPLQRLLFGFASRR